MYLEDNRTNKVVSGNKITYSLEGNRQYEEIQENAYPDMGHTMIALSIANDELLSTLIKIDLGNGFNLFIDKTEDIKKLGEMVRKINKTLKPKYRMKNIL